MPRFISCADFGRGVKTWFQSITIIQANQWPAGQFDVPANCSGH